MARSGAGRGRAPGAARAGAGGCPGPARGRRFRQRRPRRRSASYRAARRGTAAALLGALRLSVGFVLAGQRDAAGRALLLDVPLLVEADHRDRDQEQLDRYDEDGEQAEEVLGQGGAREPALVACEPGRGGNRREDGEDDRESRGHRQDAPVPPRDEKREHDVEPRPDERRDPHARSLEPGPATERDDHDQGSGHQQDEGDDRLHRLGFRLLPVGAPELVSRADARGLHRTSLESSEVARDDCFPRSCSAFRTRGRGGTGRRARFRSWWALWPLEVRVLSSASPLLGPTNESSSATLSRWVLRPTRESTYPRNCDRPILLRTLLWPCATSAFTSSNSSADRPLGM